LQILSKNQGNIKQPRAIRALILTPTRELAIQIKQSFDAYGQYLPLRTCAVFGGVSQKPQTDILKRGTDILIATPGRLIDLIQQNYIKLQNIEIFVLDEADRMLDMGFVADMRKIMSYVPKSKQTILFSATMPPEISKLINSILVNPVTVTVNPVSSTVDIIEQAVYFVDDKNKKRLLTHLLKNKSIVSALVFARTKYGADKIVAELIKSSIPSQAIHGNKSQGARQIALNNFKAKKIRVLVATDIASRGIDIEELSHVINFDLPNIPESYVHRIGRTGRAGSGGVALSFCSMEEMPYLKDIEKLIKKTIPVVKDHLYGVTVTKQFANEVLENNSTASKHASNGYIRKPRTAQVHI
jgi:ATP-dependent RNA helicase RhlE